MVFVKKPHKKQIQHFEFVELGSRPIMTNSFQSQEGKATSKAKLNCFQLTRHFLWNRQTGLEMLPL